VTQHEAPGRSSSGASLFQASAIPQVRKPLQAYSLMSGTASTNIVNRGLTLPTPLTRLRAIQPTNVLKLKRCLVSSVWGNDRT
jgi:predicted lysophospholipase L1 biosynthesis ABC-type transport system permease subunit